MSLDIYLYATADTGASEPTVFELMSENITHNLIPMWREAGCYDALYEMPGRPASDALPSIEAAVFAMTNDPARFEKHNAPNGWGLYKHALPFLISVRDGMREHPKATIRVSR